jgi:hypothetical protein
MDCKFTGNLFLLWQWLGISRPTVIIFIVTVGVYGNARVYN